MIERRAEEKAADDEEMKKSLANHLVECLSWANQNPRVEFLTIDYPTLIEDPQSKIDEIASFLGSDLVPHVENMAAVVDRSLYRNKSKKSEVSL